jgi:hypothetical protein
MNILMLLGELLRDATPSWWHVLHVCHLLYISHNIPCTTMSARQLVALGFSPARDQGVQWVDTAFVQVFNGDMVLPLRLAS